MKKSTKIILLVLVFIIGVIFLLWLYWLYSPIVASYSSRSPNTGPVPHQSNVTIGLWHESVPTGAWSGRLHKDFLNGMNKDGFKQYANLYVNYVSNILKVAATKTIKQGEFYFSIDDPLIFDVINRKITTTISTKGPSYYYAYPGGEYDAPNCVGCRPMINEHLIEPLGLAGVKKFGLSVGSYNKYDAPWVWKSTKFPKNYITNKTKINNIQVGVDSVSIESLFKLIAELNNELAANTNIHPDKKLYITCLGFDNESFGNIFPYQGMDNDGYKCMKNGVNGVLTPEMIINYLWDYYMYENADLKWKTKEHNWGKTGQSPPFYTTCQNKVSTTTAGRAIPGTSRNFAFIEWYNLPDSSPASMMVDHPSFAPNNPFWVADVKYFADNSYSSLVPPTGKSSENPKTLTKYNAYYGLNTPQKRQKLMENLERWKPVMTNNAIIAYFDKFYTQLLDPPSLYEIITGLSEPPPTNPPTNPLHSLTYPLTTYRDTPNPEYIYNLYNSLKHPGDNHGNWVTLASNYNKLTHNDPFVDVSNGTRWMLSLENVSSSYGTVKKDGLEYLTDESILPANYIDINAPESSVALKFAGNGNPFFAPHSRSGQLPSQYDLLKFLQASGTFEAFGGWELSEIMDFMLLANEKVTDTISNKKNVKNFMLYEFNFAQLRQCSPNYITPSPSVQ